MAPGASLDDYRLVLVPSLPIVSEAAERAFAAVTGIVAFGPRSGSKTRRLSIPEKLPPGPLQRFLRSRIIEVSSMRPGVTVAITAAISGHAERWREAAETQAEALASFTDGAPALIANDHYLYLACWPDAGALRSLMALLCQKAGLSTIELPAEVRLRRRGDLVLAFNYGETPWPAPFGGEPLIGAQSVAPRGPALRATFPSRVEEGERATLQMCKYSSACAGVTVLDGRAPTHPNRGAWELS